MFRSAEAAPAADAAEPEPSDDKTVFKQAPPPGQASTGTGAAAYTGPSRIPAQTGPSRTTGTGIGTGSSWTDMSQWGEGHAESMEAGSVLKDRYVLETVIGRGGMGVVFKAKDLRREEAQDRNPYIAVKILNDEFRRHPESLKALQRESRKAQDLAHPNIVTVFDFDRDGGTVYMTMEFLEGTSLDRITKNAAFDGMPLSEAYPMIEGLSNALAYAHDKGVVHSDFKPANAFLTKADVIKVFDFGIARAAKLPGDQSGEVTRFDPGTLGALTPAYASCEMLDGETPDARDDIYALACVTYELLTGRHPFDKRSAADARDNGLVPKQVQGLSRRQWRGLQRGLAFRREERSPNVETFLEDLRARTLNKTTVGIGIAAGVAIIAVGMFVVPEYLQDRRIEGMIVQITSGDDDQILATLEKLDAFALDERNTVLGDGRVEDRVIEYFRDRIYAADEQLDYPTAEALIERATSIYDDSNRLADAAEEVEQNKRDLLAELDNRFNTNLQAGSLLPSDGEDITDVLAIYERIDPNNPALTDQRLPIAYATAAEGLLNEDLVLAFAYIDAGQARFPNDLQLVGLRDRVDALREIQDRGVRIAELEGELGNALASLSTLEDFATLERDLLQLETLDPGNGVIVNYRNRIHGLVNTRVNESLTSNDWTGARDTIEQFGRLASPDFRSASLSRIETAEQRYAKQVGAVYAGLVDAARGGRFSDAERQFAELQQQGSDATTLAEAREAISRGYLGKARSERGSGEFEAARATVTAGQRFDSSFAEWQGELQAIAQAEQRQVQGEQEDQRQQRLARVSELQNSINASLRRQDFGIDAAGETLSLIDTLAELEPADPLASGGRSEVAAKLATEARAIGVQNDRLDEALELVAQAERLLPGERVLGDARASLEEQRNTVLVRRAEEAARNLRAELDQLVASPAFDRDWEANLRRAITELEPASGQADYLASKRGQIADLYLAEAERFLAEDRFDRADQMLTSSEWFVSNYAAANTLRASLTSAREQFDAENRERQRLASIDGLKRTFTAELNANRFNEARGARSRLGEILAANDPFLTTEAPRALAEAYLRIATRALSEERFDRASDLAREGLKEVANHTGLSALLAEITTLRLAYNVKQLKTTIRDAEPADSAGPRRTLATIREDAGPAFGTTLAELTAVADERVKGAGKNRDAVVSWVTNILGSYNAPAIAGPPCTPNLAGYGRRSQGRCYDFLPDQRTEGPRFVVVPSGRGVAQAFAISRQEVSVGDWNAYCKISGACSPRPGSEGVPITNVSISEVIAYTQWLSTNTEHVYRLPTDTEWEHAARAEQGSKISPNCVNPLAGLGDSLLEVNWGQPNEWGLMNYVGNAREWVVGSAGDYVVRGGAYSDRLAKCEISLTASHSGNADEVTGFRLVRELDGGA